MCLVLWTSKSIPVGSDHLILVPIQFYYPTNSSRVSIPTLLRVSTSVTLRLYVSFRYLSLLGTSLGYFHCPTNCDLHYICRSPLLSWNTKISKQFSSLFSAGLRPFHCVISSKFFNKIIKNGKNKFLLKFIYQSINEKSFRSEEKQSSEYTIDEIFNGSADFPGLMHFVRRYVKNHMCQIKLKNN